MREEQRCAVLVGWDTYAKPTCRHKAFAAYQSGRTVIHKFGAALGFANANAPAMR